MQSDLTVYKSTLEQQHSNNIQLRVLQDKLTHAQRDYEEVGETVFSIEVLVVEGE